MHIICSVGIYGVLDMEYLTLLDSEMEKENKMGSISVIMELSRGHGKANLCAKHDMRQWEITGASSVERKEV